MPNYYEIMGVDQDASAGDIRKAYLSFSKENHPDKIQRAGGSDEEIQAANEKFQDVKKAYDVLSDEDSRKDYDKELASQPAAALESNAVDETSIVTYDPNKANQKKKEESEPAPMPEKKEPEVEESKAQGEAKDEEKDEKGEDKEATIGKTIGKSYSGSNPWGDVVMDLAGGVMDATKGVPSMQIGLAKKLMDKLVDAYKSRKNSAEEQDAAKESAPLAIEDADKPLAIEDADKPLAIEDADKPLAIEAAPEAEDSNSMAIVPMNAMSDGASPSNFSQVNQLDSLASSSQPEPSTDSSPDLEEEAGHSLS